jgi:hypothetical protein
MGVNVRERKPREWWVFINHKGRRKTKKVGSREAADATASVIEEKLGTEVEDRTAANLLDTPKPATQAQPTEMQVQFLSPND